MKRDSADIYDIINRISLHDDEKAFRQLFESYSGRMIETAKFYVNDHYSAKDIVSEVFIKIWKNRCVMQSIQNIASYLFVATKRQSLNYLRNNKKNLHFPIDEKEAIIQVDFSSPESKLLFTEFEEVINRAISDLPSKCRLVYLLVKDEKMKYQEVADALNISIKTVEMHIGKALKRINHAICIYKKK